MYRLARHFKCAGGDGCEQVTHTHSAATISSVFGCDVNMADLATPGLFAAEINS